MPGGSSQEEYLAVTEVKELGIWDIKGVMMPYNLKSRLSVLANIFSDFQFTLENCAKEEVKFLEASRSWEPTFLAVVESALRTKLNRKSLQL